MTHPQSFDHDPDPPCICLECSSTFYAGPTGNCPTCGSRQIRLVTIPECSSFEQKRALAMTVIKSLNAVLERRLVAVEADLAALLAIAKKSTP